MDRKTELCSGNCGKVMLKTDMTLSCYDDLYCNDCMSIFISEQDYHGLSENSVPWSEDDYRRYYEMVGGDNPCDYE